ncbi:hypothetical protein A5765_18840 [Mycolicibacterium celeriflavum]|nr:hypothetical protein A5765_18840 [Mycolicibacterium celeriflavum]
MRWIGPLRYQRRYGQGRPVQHFGCRFVGLDPTDSDLGRERRARDVCTACGQQSAGFKVADEGKESLAGLRCELTDPLVIDSHLNVGFASALRLPFVKGHEQNTMTTRGHEPSQNFEVLVLLRDLNERRPRKQGVRH